MALNKKGLAEKLKAAFSKEGGNTAEAAANAIAEAIDSYVKEATVTGTFSGASSVGPVTGTLNGGNIV